jgi:hypothetical protein
MYVAPDQWSVPDEGDPPPCFRQGDLVRVSWFRPEMNVTDNGATVRLTSIEMRTEVVALLSACCDLVDRTPPKRKGVLISPLRPVPKNVAKKPELLAALKVSAAEAAERGVDVPANLFFFAGTTDVSEGVVHLEAMAMLEFPLLKTAKKLAQLTDGARQELQERIKFHFVRTETAEGERPVR